jgi:hypothetical protein
VAETIPKTRKSDGDDSVALEQLRAVATDPVTRKCFKEIEAIAGFKLTADQRAAFLRFHAYITTDPRPKYISELRAGNGRRYQMHVNGIPGGTQNTLACVYYHLAQLEKMESSVERIIESSGLRDLLGNATTAGGNTLALDFEYQAFVLGVRRCLDYLTRGLANYFKNDFHSFRRFSGFLGNATPRDIATTLQQAHARHVGYFDFVLSQSERRSTRDRISHYEFVPAGIVNISSRGFVLAGGGENLGGHLSNPSRRLADVLRSHAGHLQQCIDDFLDSFVAASKAHEDKLVN